MASTVASTALSGGRRATGPRPATRRSIPESARGKARGLQKGITGDSLTEAEIVRAARNLIAEVGVDGLTMRRLSEALGVALGATYHHVATKHQLLVLVGRDLYSEISHPPGGGPWDVLLKKMMLSHAALVRRYPGMGNFMMLHVDELRPTELNLLVRNLLVDAGFSERSITAVLSALFFYVTGITAGGLANPMDKMLGGRNVLAIFEDGLDVLIDGAKARLEADRTAKRRATQKRAQR